MNFFRTTDTTIWKPGFREREHCVTTLNTDCWTTKIVISHMFLNSKFSLLLHLVFLSEIERASIEYHICRKSKADQTVKGIRNF